MVASVERLEIITKWNALTGIFMKQNIYILFLLIICGIPEKQDPGPYEDPGP